MTNTYRLATRTKTTGLVNVGLDVNSYNDYGMAPLHVAAMAGAVSDFRTLVQDPRCDLSIKTTTGESVRDFISVHKQVQTSERERHYGDEMMKILKEEQEARQNQSTRAPVTATALAF